jgi:hypothetical protein
VRATEKGIVQLVATENQTEMGYMLPYNQFVALKDYDLSIFYRNGFKSQKYPPQKISLSDDNIYLDDNYGEFYAFRASEEGQRAKFDYEYNYTDAKYLTRLFFHESFPVLKNVITFKVPNWLKLDIQEMNFNGYNIRKEIKSDKDNTTYTFTATNLSSIIHEPHGLSKPYYLPHLVITVREFSSEQKQFNGFKSIDDMYAWYNLLYKKAENNTDDLKAPLQNMLAGKTTDEAKIKSIYYWVQDNIRYVAFEEGYSGFVPHTAQLVFKNKFGDCKGMANLLTELLKMAGYDAHFSWIGTRTIPYDRKTVQSLCVDNHAICVLYFKGKTYFLDGTQKYQALGKNAYRIQGKNVLVQNGNQYKTEMVPATVLSDNSIQTKANLSLKQDALAGHIAMVLDGETKNIFLNVYNSLPTPKRKELLEGMMQLNDRNTMVTNIKSSDFKDRDIPISIEADVQMNNHVTAVANMLYTSIDFFPQMYSSYVPDEKRQSPLDFENVFVARDEIVLQLPPNTKASSLPAPFQVSFKENKIVASYEQQGNTLMLKKNFEFNTPVIFNPEFAEYRKFMNAIKEFNNSNIILTTP